MTVVLLDIEIADIYLPRPTAFTSLADAMGLPRSSKAVMAFTVRLSYDWMDSIEQYTLLQKKLRVLTPKYLDESKNFKDQDPRKWCDFFNEVCH